MTAQGEMSRAESLERDACVVWVIKVVDDQDQINPSRLTILSYEHTNTAEQYYI
jgi:hypothetical protein